MIEIFGWIEADEGGDAAYQSDILSAIDRVKPIGKQHTDVFDLTGGVLKHVELFAQESNVDRPHDIAVGILG
jgi:hypothetical protein